jgi:uncharacterized protein (DUF885 family)
VPTPAAIAPFGTGGNGGLESCLMNTYNLPARPLYTIPPLTLHECVPGHSFQAALALEGPNRPAIRKRTYFSGYGEGWALYMEWLGTKMGVYETPYDEFGRETYEMWRAARLVVDTGLHHMGWSRQQALDYLSSHTALSDHEVTIEVDRYINDPGQALAYKLGEMLIRRKRAEAEAKLGANFDQRWFHDTILGLGSVPLPTLEKACIDDWIAAAARTPTRPNPDPSFPSFGWRLPLFVRSLMLVSALALMAGAPAISLAQTAAPAAAAATDADSRLKALYDTEWAWRQKEFGRLASDAPFSGGAGTLQHVDAATQETRLAYWTKTLAELNKIPVDQLSPEEKINAAVFRTSLEAFVSQGKYRAWEAPFNADSQFWSGVAARSSYSQRRRLSPLSSAACATSRAISTSRSST